MKFLESGHPNVSSSSGMIGPQPPNILNNSEFLGLQPPNVSNSSGSQVLPKYA